MGYDTIGNIKSKTQLHEKLPYEGDKWIEQQKTTYDWTYEHTAKQPHAPTKIGNRTFTYDLNGNQTGWENTQNANNRVIEWDEENRITTVSDNGHTSYYVYDAGGERTLKRSAQGETFYVNPYFVIREGQVASKHFFAGSQRVATKLTKQESQTVHGKGGNDKPAKIIYEKEQYFYHPDHLGSSSFVTDEKGEVYEHLEYFPFGETFAHEHSNTQITPYRFTGKELDEVTGLYYYGARYYDPRTSVWQSPDPILDQYMSGQTNGGVFNPKNLSLFSYTYNNPVNFIDPDGNLVFPNPFELSPTDIALVKYFYAGNKKYFDESGNKKYFDASNVRNTKQIYKGTNAVKDMRKNLKKQMYSFLKTVDNLNEPITKEFSTKGNYSVESDEIYSLGRGEHKAKACCQILQEKKKNIFNCKVTYSTIDKFEDPIDLKEDGYTDKYHNLGGDPFTFAIKAEETINIQIKNNNGENK